MKGDDEDQVLAEIMKLRWSTVGEDTAQGLDQIEMEKAAEIFVTFVILSGLLNEKMVQIVKMKNFDEQLQKC